jgi:hypothetical protein
MTMAVAARYMAPVSRKSSPISAARRRATVDLPVPAGPSMVMMMGRLGSRSRRRYARRGGRRGCRRAFARRMSLRDRTRGSGCRGLTREQVLCAPGPFLLPVAGRSRGGPAARSRGATRRATRGGLDRVAALEHAECTVFGALVVDGEGALEPDGLDRGEHGDDVEGGVGRAPRCRLMSMSARSSSEPGASSSRLAGNRGRRPRTRGGRVDDRGVGREAAEVEGRVFVAAAASKSGRVPTRKPPIFLMSSVRSSGFRR